MTNEEQLGHLDDSMTEAKRFIDIRDSIAKLEKNREFKKVITDYYFKDEAARLVMAKSSSLTEDQQVVIDKMIYGIGSLAKFLDSAVARGNQAEQAYAEDEQAKEEIIAEGLL
jgi:glutaredoxin-related protein